MKQASVLLFLFAFLLLTATAAQAQLMRKDTATLPRSKWEVGLDLKPIWDRSEPYNFVVRYFFKDRWALRGGMGLEMNWSKDTLDVEERQNISPDPTLRYELYELQEQKHMNLQIFLGIQHRYGKGKLQWYNAVDLFYFRIKDYYDVPVATNGRGVEPPVTVPDFVRIVFINNIKNGGGVRVINGLDYRLSPDISISTEIALLAQGFEYKAHTYTRDNSVFGNETFKNKIQNGWSYSLKIEPLFRFFINYHF